MQTDDVECLSRAYIGKNRDPLYEAAMDIIFKANREVYEEARDMCEAIRELFADEFERLEQELTEQGVSALIETCMEVGLSREAALAKVIEKYGLKSDQAQKHMEKIWKNVL